MDNMHMIARIVAVYKDRFQMYSEKEGELFGQLKAAVYYQPGSPDFPTAGDLVIYSPNPYGDSLITNTLPRKSLFQRFDAFSAGRPQVIAANFDNVFILTSANHDFNPKRLHRYLSAARSSGANYAIVITKSDVTNQIESFIQQAHQAAGEICPVFAISAYEGQGLEPIASLLLPDSISVFLGSSGVGKSTLVNALAGRVIMDVNGIREDDSKGRHTTTRRQMIRLENGAWILDTPGMREFGLTDVQEGLSETFDDICLLMNHCRFANCRHSLEPGCAVKAAIEAGVLDRRRWEEYLILEKEAKRKAPRTQEETRLKLQRQKEISKYSKKLKASKRETKVNSEK